MTAVTTKQFLALTQEMAAAMERVSKQAAERIKQLEARVQELEQGPTLLAQPYKSGSLYPKGAFCEFRGCLYRAQCDTQRPPMAGGDDWQILSSVKIRYAPGSV